jgi:GT2 family glycosyltransferase
MQDKAIPTTSAETSAVRPPLQGCSRAPVIAIIIVNWRGWRDTVECLHSLLALRNAKYRVIVCDNNSGDASVDMIEKWARGEFTPQLTGSAWAEIREFDRLPHPVSYQRVGHGENIAQLANGSEPLVTIIEADANLGFAGGTNAGLRHAMTDPRFTHFWLLNNDTVVHADAAAMLLSRGEECHQIGLCGSRIMRFDDPGKIQACGGSRYEWGRAWGHAILDSPFDRDHVESQLSYISGASTFATRSFVEQVGLLSEDYFLYFEEMDWVVRAAERFCLAYAPQSIVYHKEGKSIGSSSFDRPSNLSLRYMTANRLVFTRKYAGEQIWNLRRELGREALSYIKRGDWHAALIFGRTILLDLFLRPRRTKCLSGNIWNHRNHL